MSKDALPAASREAGGKAGFVGCLVVAEPYLLRGESVRVQS